MHRFCLVFALLMSSACVSYQSSYEERLVRTLPNQREVTFSNEQAYPGKILCGKYSALVGGGFVRETRDFVVTPSQVLQRPDRASIAVYCSKTSAEALAKEHGVSPEAGDWSSLAQLNRDMQAIKNAINAYYDTTYALPSSLTLLLDGSFGVTGETLIDPWGNTYYYRGGLSGRTTPQFELLSFGADGEPGGKAAATDIPHQMLPLLNHVLSLEAP